MAFNSRLPYLFVRLFQVFSNNTALCLWPLCLPLRAIACNPLMSSNFLELLSFVPATVSTFVPPFLIVQCSLLAFATAAWFIDFKSWNAILLLFLVPCNDVGDRCQMQTILFLKGKNPSESFILDESIPILVQSHLITTWSQVSYGPGYSAIKSFTL